jgi:hypothetical protein
MHGSCTMFSHSCFSRMASRSFEAASADVLPTTSLLLAMSIQHRQTLTENSTIIASKLCLHLHLFLEYCNLHDLML